MYAVEHLAYTKILIYLLKPINFLLYVTLLKLHTCLVLLDETEIKEHKDG